MKKNLLLARMALAGLNQKALAERIPMTSARLSRKINGKEQFTVAQIKRICEILKIEDDAEKADIFLR